MFHLFVASFIPPPPCWFEANFPVSAQVFDLLMEYFSGDARSDES